MILVIYKLSVKNAIKKRNIILIPAFNETLVIKGNCHQTKLIYQYFSGLTPAQNIPPDPDLLINSIPDKIIQENIDSFEEGIYFSFIGVNFFTPSSRHDDAIILKYFGEIMYRDEHLPGDITKKMTKNNRFWRPRRRQKPGKASIDRSR